MARNSLSNGYRHMRFGGGFLGLKAVSLGLRSFVFLCVLTLSDSVFGANHLMSFMSFVTVLGIALSFGALDSVAVSSDDQAVRISRLVLLASLLGIGATSLLMLGSYWINVSVACINYGLSFWNLGLVRRRNSILFERISNLQMLIFWTIYLALLPLEAPSLGILSLLYAMLNGVVAIIAYKTGCKAVGTESSTQESYLYHVSISKLAWEINYSGLTRMPFLLPGVSATLHTAFGYAYFLFEMASAMLSHYQTIFLKSRVASTLAWFHLSAALLVVNAVTLASLLVAIQFQYKIIELLAHLPGRQQVRVVEPILRDDIISLALFMLAITALQSAAFGRYALKLEANMRVVLVASALAVTAFASSWALSPGYPSSLLIPFAFMLLAGLILVVVIFTAKLNQCRSMIL